MVGPLPQRAAKLAASKRALALSTAGLAPSLIIPHTLRLLCLGMCCRPQVCGFGTKR